MKKKVLCLLMIAMPLLTLPACNTVKGVGRDITSVGQAGSDAINR